MLPAEIVQQVKRIQFHTGKQVSDVLAGAYLSVFKGRGMEFDEVRPYVPGDDIRTIDWNVTARVGEPYIKRYVEERELTVVLLVDTSASLDFGSKERSKREAAVELSALLAFSAIQNNDKVGLLLFHGETEEYIPPRKGQKHAMLVIREVLARGKMALPDNRKDNWSSQLKQLFAQLGRKRRQNRQDRQNRQNRQGQQAANTSSRATNIAQALEFCHRVLPRKTVIFLISDFLDAGYMRVLQSANRRHDVVAVLIEDERENHISGAGLITLEDAETGARVLVDTGSSEFQRAHQEGAKQRVESLHKKFLGSGIDLIRIDAGLPVIEPLLKFFRMRERRLRR